MNKVIIWSNEGGNVSVCYPTGEISLEEVLAKDCPEGAVVVDNDSLPNEHSEFFNAWKLNAGSVSVDLDKAKEITKVRLRVERKPLFEAQDIAFQRATETGADTAAIVAEKQRLRDITQLADAATTVDELKVLKAGA